MSKEPLVSITIITYNSSKYVQEALESAKSQTYKRVELIVSDDCSTDNTIDIVDKWINENRSRFERVELLTVKKNTGVSGNVNRARCACRGEYIKGFAGDDILLPTCIEDNVKFVQDNPDALVVLSNSIIFFDDNSKTLVQKPGELVPGFFKMSAQEQYEKLIQFNDIIMNPNSQFAQAELLKSITTDERMRFMEDRQFYWKCTSRGIKLSYLDKQTVKYRKHKGALTGLSGNKLISLKYIDSWIMFYYLVRKPEMEKRSLDKSKDEKRILWYLFVKYILKNNGNIFTRLLSRCVERLFIN